MVIADDVEEKAREHWDLDSSDSDASVASPRRLPPHETSALLDKFRRGRATPFEARTLLRTVYSRRSLLGSFKMVVRDVSYRPEKIFAIFLVASLLLVPAFFWWNSSFPGVSSWDAMVQNSQRWLEAREAQLAGGASPLFPACTTQDKVYVYHLPPEFNRYLVGNCSTLNPWRSLCSDFFHSGLGPTAKEFESALDMIIWWLMAPFRIFQTQGLARGERHWYLTNIFFLEPIFHARLLAHPCRTLKPEEATMFYLPYYIGLALDATLYTGTSEEKDRLPLKFVEWLLQQEYYQRHGGIDHFMAMGRATWDFKRAKDKKGWGTSFSRWPEIKNMTRLMVSRDPWDKSEIGVPFPTFFHPTTGTEVRAWQERMMRMQRPHLASYVAGMEYTTGDLTLRRILHEQCMGRWWPCNRVDCGDTWGGSQGTCERPELPMSAYMSSEFCLQPPADEEHARSMFLCIIGGGIPVFFHHDTAYTQYKWHLPSNFSSYSVMIAAEDITSGNKTLAEFLGSFSAERKLELRRNIIENILPRVIYGDPWDYRLSDVKDAVDIAMEGMAARIQQLMKDR